MMSKPYSVSILVADGDPDGIRIIEQPNWSGRGVAFPWARWEAVRDRGECDAPGVYVLVAAPADPLGLPLVALGSGAPLLHASIDAARGGPEPWTWGVAFTSPRLEAVQGRRITTDLWRRAAAFGRCRVLGGALPPEVPISERPGVEAAAFLDEVLRLVPLLGLHVFTAPPRAPASA